jgi:hypothetical protein
VRAMPSRFQVYLLNHSDKLSQYKHKESVYIILLKEVINTMSDISNFTEQEFYKILEMDEKIIGFPRKEKTQLIKEMIKFHLKDQENPELTKLYKDIEIRLLLIIKENSFELDRVYSETSGDKTKTVDHGNVVIQNEPDDQVTYSGDIARGKISIIRECEECDFLVVGVD